MITSIEQATPAWLTAALRDSGAICAEKVVAVHRRDNEAFNSIVAHLELVYAPGAPVTVPHRILLKLNADHAGAEEVRFYQLAAELPERPPMLARCYATSYDPVSGNSYLLLEDLSETHRTPLTRAQVLALQGVPSYTQLAHMVEALAGFHAFWWEHPRLGTMPDVTEVRWWYRDREHFDRHIARRRDEWARFVAAVGEWLPADLRELYERALAGLPGLWESELAPRVATLANLTLSNGDCYFSQFLCPDDPAGHAYIVDFQDVSANFSAYDLVYMFATFWTPEQRRADGREERLLRRYHDALRAHGVSSYTWEDLLEDYRLMLALMIFDPVWNQTSGSSEAYWRPKLACLTAAYRDWRCADLFG